MVTAYSAFQRMAQRCGPPGTPVADPPSTLPPIPSDAAVALLSVGLKEDMIPKLTDLGYTDEPTSVFKVRMAYVLKEVAFSYAVTAPAEACLSVLYECC